MGDGETVGALGDFDFQAVVWGGGDALDALSGADFEHFAAFPYGFAVGGEENGGCAAYGDFHLKLAHVAVVAQDTRAEEALGRVEAVEDAVEPLGEDGAHLEMAVAGTLARHVDACQTAWEPGEASAVSDVTFI